VEYNGILRTLFWFPDRSEHSLMVNRFENILIDSFVPHLRSLVLGEMIVFI